MKKLIMISLAVLAVMVLCLSVLAAEGDGGEITVSFVKSRDPFDTGAGLDKVAMPDGKLVLSSGESFTVPDAADDSYAGKEGYVIVWYTENGRVYMPGDVVSFTEDTRLYRCLAKEIYSASDIGSALSGDTRAAILMDDFDVTSRLGTKGEDQSILVMNGHTLNISVKDSAIGNQRSGKHIVGEGTVNITNPNKKDGQYGVFLSKSHSYNGNRNKQTVGVDVTINAPQFDLINDSDGAYVTGYPWVRVYGTINVYSLGYVVNGNRSPRVEIFEGATVTVNAPTIFRDNMNLQALQLNVYGGTFNLPEAAKNPGFWSNDVYDSAVHTSEPKLLTSANFDKINIMGGTFNCAVADIAIRNEGYACVYDEATGLYSVVAVPCTGESHNYVMAEAYNGFERTCTTVGVYYYRCECGAYKTQIANELGHSYTIVEVETEATATQNGVKRVYCDRCGDNYTYAYALDPREAEIEIQVMTSEGLKAVTLLMGDLFDISTEETAAGFFCTINSIKDGEGYTKNDIVKLQIGAGVITVPAGVFKDLSSLKEITLLDRADVIFETGSLNNCQALEAIVAVNCVPTFKKNTATNCPAFATLDLRLSGAVFEASAFDMNTSMENLLLGAGNAYTFGEAAFHGSGLKSLQLVDNATIKIAKKVFAECLSLEYVYVGYNTIEGKTIPNEYSVFDGNSNLKVAVIMDLTNLGKWSFSGKEPGKAFGPLCDLKIYSHSETLTIHADAFNNRKGNYHVFLYTLAPNLTSASYSNCNMTVYNGIPHEYQEGVIIPSTCVTQGTAGYMTDCPCGLDYRESKFTTYSSFDNSLKNVEHEPYGTETFALPLDPDHTLSDTVKDIVYKNGMTGKGTAVYKCFYCDEASGEAEEATYAPLFISYGYSVSTYGDFAITFCYGVDKEAYSTYLGVNGGEVIYGVAAALKANAENGSLVGADGKAVNAKIISYSCVNAVHDVFNIKVNGLEKYTDTELYVTGYYIVGGEVYYISSSPVTYNGIAANA